MAAAAGIEFPLHRQEAWSRFRALSLRRIEEGNLVAGEAVWALSEAEGASPQFTIGRACGGADAVECSLDTRTGILTCQRRPAIEGGIWAVRLAEQTVEEAVSLLLDGLNWSDAGDMEGPEEQ